ncbi:MAG: MFS transporter [Aggregatilineales bacterium]
MSGKTRAIDAPLVATDSLSAKPGTFAALRYYNFRLYFGGQLVSTSGTWMQTVAQSALVFDLTQSALWLGIVACAAGLPSLLLSPFAGVIVERVPRRRILVFTQSAQMILAFALSALVLTQVVQVWHIVVLALLLGMTNAIDAPARQAFVIDMVGREDLSSGIALNSLMFNLSRVVGPTAAGLALATVGAGWCFFLNGASFLAVIVSLFFMHITPTDRRITSLSVVKQLREGLRFAGTHATIGPLLLLALSASMFASNASTLFPAFAGEVLKSPDQAYAALVTANGIGAVLAAAFVTWLGRRFGRGRMLAIMAVVDCLATGLLAVTGNPDHISPTLFLGTIYGFSLILQFVTMNTLIQTEVPDDFRGRVSSLYTLTFFGAAPFGALFLGLAAQGLGTPVTLLGSAVIGGLLNVLILARAAALRRLP